MKPEGAVLYSAEDLTLQRVAAGQRSQGDGQEQATPSRHSQESTKQKLTKKKINKNNSKTPESNSEKAWISKDSEDSTLGRRESDVIYSPESVDNYLPSVADIAHKLTKVNIMSSPDTHLLNTPPKDLKTKEIILLHPTTPKNRPSQSKNQSTSSQVYSKRRKEPKFVPYEPYKGCVKPIRKKSKANNKQSSGDKPRTKVVKGEELNTLQPNAREESDVAGAEKRNTEKLSIMVKDFERERALWEKQMKSVVSAKESMEEQLTQIKKEKSNLESQLSIQSQVNTELKKLLVASVGEDVQGRVQCLTEDKARMATMIRHYSEKVDRDYEEKERIGIQCDVWRSKFLGSSMLVDELAGWKAMLMRRMEEAEEALRVLREEHGLARQHILNMYKMNKQLRDAFDPLAAQSGGVPPLTSADLVSLAVDGDILAETVRDRLLGDLGRAVGCTLSLDGLETETPGEKMALQAVENVTNNPVLMGRLCTDREATCVECSTVSPGASAMMQRFHPHTRYEHVTVNCCAHCNGEIKVV